MRQQFTEERLEKRIKAFCIFVEQQNFLQENLKKERNNVCPFLVYTQELEFAKVGFSPLGGIYIIAPEGKLKTYLLEWIKQEQPRYRDTTTEKKVEKLEQTFREKQTLLPITPAQDSIGSAITSIRLISKDNPLVELAELLGYAVYITSSELSQESPSSRYLIRYLDDAPPLSGENLVKMLAFLIRQKIE
jgi:hypothetical protein